MSVQSTHASTAVSYHLRDKRCHYCQISPSNSCRDLRLRDILFLWLISLWFYCDSMIWSSIVLWFHLKLMIKSTTEEWYDIHLFRLPNFDPRSVTGSSCYLFSTALRYPRNWNYKLICLWSNPFDSLASFLFGGFEDVVAQFCWQTEAGFCCTQSIARALSPFTTVSIRTLLAAT